MNIISTIKIAIIFKMTNAFLQIKLLKDFHCGLFSRYRWSRKWSTQITCKMKQSHLSTISKISDSVAFEVNQIEDDLRMEHLGSCLAGALCEGDVILLKGDLGAGKSTLARGVIRNLCQDNSLMVTSPTYLLDNTYLLSDVDGGDPTCGVHEHDAVIHHLDLYRLPNGCDLTFLSIPKIYARNLCLIEWPERLGKFKPDDYVDIDLRIHPENDHRSALITLNGEKYADRVEDFANSLHEFRINQHHAL